MEFTEKDRGRYVKYKPTGEIGRLKTWKGVMAFVVYHCNDEWDRYEDFTAAQTHGLSLEFMPDDFQPTKQEILFKDTKEI